MEQVMAKFRNFYSPQKSQDLIYKGAGRFEQVQIYI